MDKQCTVYKTVDFIGKRWTLLILLELYKGKSEWKRYSEIKKGLLDITPKILSARLKELSEKGMIIKRINTEQFPIKSEYRLTEKGKEFMKVIKDIKKWALKWNIKNKVCEHSECKSCKF